MFKLTLINCTAESDVHSWCVAKTKDKRVHMEIESSFPELLFDNNVDCRDVAGHFIVNGESFTFDKEE